MEPFEPRTSDYDYEKNLVELIQGFTDLIERLNAALPASETKDRLIRKLMDDKREVTLLVVNELK